MRVITLNTWGGRAGKAGLLSFLAKHKDDTDIFCLQEIWSASYEHLEGKAAGGAPIDHNGIMVHGMQEISALLAEHTPYFRPHFMDHYGLLMLVRKNSLVIEEGEVFVHKSKGYLPEGDAGHHARNIQYVTIDTSKCPLTVINFHGLWNGKGKTDTEERVLQSKNILNFINGLSGEHICCGDFNLLPNTESIRLFESYGLRNLIKEYGVTSTRTSFYAKPEKHADYVFVSGGIHVKDFMVLPDEVSDHAPLLLDLA